MDEDVLSFWQADMVRQIAEEIDRDALTEIQAAVKRQEEALVAFFCLVGPARAEVLGDMALDGLEWPEFIEPPVQRMFRARWSL